MFATTCFICDIGSVQRHSIDASTSLHQNSQNVQRMRVGEMLTELTIQKVPHPSMFPRCAMCESTFALICVLRRL